MRYQHRLLWAFFILLILGPACKNSNSVLSRFWHNTTAHYNIYFNAEQAWLLNVANLRDGYVDDYRSFLEIYNYGAEAILRGNQGPMDDVVKQLSTMIDKHPRSKWVDDAYLLIGKAYFMKGDFIAANDLFEYVNSTFKDPIIKYQSRLWMFQCLYARGKITEAENFITALKNDPEFPKKLKHELNMALGAIYLKQKKSSQAAEPLELALKGAKLRIDKYRLHFILGQVYQDIAKYDTAERHFSRVIRLNPPYEMAFQSEINRVELLSQKSNNYSKANKILRRMLKDDKNIEYYGQIYYRLGRNELRAGNDDKAIPYFQKSLSLSAQDKTQATTTYLTLGDYFYKNRSFEKAGLYYDSANRLLDENHPDYEKIAQKGATLSDLLRNLLTIKRQDSLLKLARDPVYREKTIDFLMAQEKQRIADAAKVKNNPAPVNPNPTPPGGLPGGNIGNNTASSFPFYNPASRARGAIDFQSNWGTRTNRDNWRLNSKKGAANEKDTTNSGNNTNNINIPTNITQDRKKYYDNIPLTKESQAAAEAQIEDAIFNAAGIYQNGLLEPEQAIRYYNELLYRFPNTKYEAKALYELAKLYKDKNDMVSYELSLNKLETKYPESIYVKLLKDPEAAKKQVKSGPGLARKEIEDLYQAMYAAYQSMDYENAMTIKLRADQQYAGNNLQSKFDYLYAACLLKTGKEKQALDALKQVASDYAGTEIGDLAQNNINAIANKNTPTVIDSSSSIPDSASVAGLWKKWDQTEDLYCLIIYKRGANSNLLRAGLTDYNKENFVFETLEVSPIRAIGETVFLSVTNYSKPEIAKNYVSFMVSKPDFFASKGLYEYDIAWISKTNYTALIQNNRINSYVDFFKSGMP